MKTLKQYIKEAEDKGTAIGHFNISNLEILKGIFESAKKLEVPVIIGLAEGEGKFVGIKQAVALVKSLREEYLAPDGSGGDYPIFLNADHTHTFEGVKEVIDAGYDAVIFDGSELSYDENLKMTKKCVDYARRVNPDILVEAELGFIGSSSKVLEAVPTGVNITDEFLTKPEEVITFVEATGVDLIAPAVGNIHGMLKGGKNPALNIGRISEIKAVSSVPLVLHGASGNSAEDIQNAIKAGISLIHVNTEIRVAYRQALVKSLQDNPDEIAPYKYLKDTVQAVSSVVEEKLKLFSNL